MKNTRNTEKDNIHAMGMMIMAMLLLPGIDAIAKSLTTSLSSGQITWSRFFFQVIFMSLLLFGTKGSWFNRNLYLHAIRGTCIALATLLFFTGLKYLPIANAITLFFIEPLLVTLLSVLLLGERVGWRRLSAIIVGFIGALIVIRPSFNTVGWPVLYPIAAALCFSFYIILTRKLVRHEDPIRLQFFTGVFGLIFMSIALLVGVEVNYPLLIVVWPTTIQWSLLVALGLIATIGHLLVVYAFRRAPVNMLAPFQYVEIIGATILGYLFFDDFPDMVTWIGVAIIVGSGIFVFHREARVKSIQ